METVAKQLPRYYVGKVVNKYLILEAISFAFTSIDATEYLFQTSKMFRKLIALNLIALSKILKAPEKEVVEVGNRFEMLFNKSIQQKYLKVELNDEGDLKILKQFLKKIKLNIEEISIKASSHFKMMTKEDFKLIKP
jgi:hypothetical protein